MPGRILVGTSSWADPEFVRDWYPPGLQPRARLAYYAQRFELVEVNSTFYQVPPAQQVAQWVSETPAGFIFDVKLHRSLSRHRCEPRFLPKALQKTAKISSSGGIVLTEDLQDAVLKCVLESIGPLEKSGKLGVMLLQLSPSFSPRTATLEELDGVVSKLAPRPLAFEFRNRGWVESPQEEKTLAYLSERNIGMVLVDAPRADHFTIMPPTDYFTTPRLAYLRLHGRDAHAYLSGKTVADRFNYLYSEPELFEIKQRAEVLAAHAEVLHVLFNNNRSNFAPKNAARFRQILNQDVHEESQGLLF